MQDADWLRREVEAGGCESGKSGLESSLPSVLLICLDEDLGDVMRFQSLVVC